MEKKVRTSLLILVMTALVSAPALPAQTVQDTNAPQYLFNKFSEGVVKMKNGQKITANLDYNIVTEEMIFIDNNNYRALAGLEKIDTVYLNGKVFIPVNGVFYEQACTGTVSLYVQYSAVANKTGDEVGYGGTSQTSRVSTITSFGNDGGIYKMDQPDNFRVDRDITYWILRDGKMSRFVNNKGFLKIFKEYKEELSSYIDKNKLDLSEYNDAVKAVMQLNDIIGQ